MTRRGVLRGGRLLVTGGAGFIGSNFVRRALADDPELEVVNLDALTYAGVRATVDELDADPRHTFVHGDIGDPEVVADAMRGVDAVVHLAAESHVDRSIDDPDVVLRTNVLGTGTLLREALQAGVRRFVQVSTDEVYGSVPSGFRDESARLAPASPYSASKAAADLLALSYHTTFGLDVVVTRCTNNYGPYQFPEKLVPLFITNLLEGRSVPVYGDGTNERDWLHVHDHCDALSLVLEAGEPGSVYNVGTGSHLSNLELTHRLLDLLDVDPSSIEHVADRPGHDLRYAVDTTRIRSLGWQPRHTVDDRLAETVAWYRERRDWWEPLRASVTPNWRATSGP